MKRICFIILTVMFAIPAGSIAQCVNSLQYITYDTTVTGGGNSIYNFTFPKFNASTGTLIEVQIKSEVTLRFGFQLENTGNVAVSGYRVRLDRNDQITSAALQNPVDSTFPRKTYGPYTFTATDGIPDSGTDYYSEPQNYVLNASLINRTVYNTAEYLGSGNVEFEYTANSFTIMPTGPVVYNLNTEDEVKFSITYVVCPTFFLASDISFFTARKKDDLSVTIQWITYNETENRKYILEKSSDGKGFDYVEEFSASPKNNQTGSYIYQYHSRADEKGKIIFRLKQIEKSGSVKYSALRVVELSKIQIPVRVFPNPSHGPVNIVFHNQKRSDWIVEVATIRGQLIERIYYKNVLMARMNVQNRLQKGTYLLRIIHKRSEEQTVQKLIIQ